MVTVTTPMFVHVANEPNKSGRRETACHRVTIALGPEHEDIIYTVDAVPKPPTCLWCAVGRSSQ